MITPEPIRDDWLDRRAAFFRDRAAELFPSSPVASTFEHRLRADYLDYCARTAALVDPASSLTSQQPTARGHWLDTASSSAGSSVPSLASSRRLGWCRGAYRHRCRCCDVRRLGARCHPGRSSSRESSPYAVTVRPTLPGPPPAPSPVPNLCDCRNLNHFQTSTARCCVARGHGAGSGSAARALVV